MTPLILASTSKALVLARRIARIWPGTMPAGPEDFADLARAAFLAGRPIVGLCGAELLIRTLAPLIEAGPAAAPVLVVAPDGMTVVPLLGDEALARRIASALCASVAISAAEPRLLVGIGCERGVSADEITGTVTDTLAEAGLAATAVALLCSIDTKRDDLALKEAALRFGRPLRLFDAATLEAETPRLANPSELVFRIVGCHGVAEAAALAAAGAAARLIVPKRRAGRVTCAVALDRAS
jgi:cobalamin biosynthesis protein CbiG